MSIVVSELLLTGIIKADCFCLEYNDGQAVA
jgi:hypothetical protein